MIVWLTAIGLVGTGALLAWCRWADVQDRRMAVEKLRREDEAREAWMASAAEWERLDQALTGSAPWRGRPVR